MNIGYQGEKNCYSYQVVKKYLNENKAHGYNNFELVFDALENQEVDYAVLPIENSLGGCIFVNFDFFYKYDIIIHCEFHHNINHSLYSLSSNINEIKTVISHPQALQQCINNIKNNDLTPIDFWDTTGSLNELLEKKDNTLAAIAPPGLKEEFGVNELITNFNDQENNITRFYLISLKKRELEYQEIVKVNTNIVKNKFSGYIIAKDQVGILSDYLDKFKNNNYNLTKIESRPYLGQDRKVFSYIFYLEGVIKNLISKKQFSKKIDGFKHFGQFPLLEITDKKLENKERKTSIAIIGFGRFGQFIGEQMINFGFNVYATSRTDYTELAKELGIIFLDKESFLSLNMKQPFDIVIIATSILSFEKVLKSYPYNFWENKLLVDVLSVKLYPQEIINEYLKYINCSILLTHPMFGPDSAKSFCFENAWNNKNFVYWKEKIINNNLVDEFLSFWDYQGCNMIEMSPDKHDKLTANSQFLTHFIGRTLELLNCQNTEVDTDGYKSLVTIKNHSINDSWDLFYALAKYNPKSIDTINKLKYQLNKLETRLFPNEIKESKTGIVFSKILKLNKGLSEDDEKYVINSAIGVPTWYPKLEYSSAYSKAKGNNILLDKLVDYYQNQDLDISIDNLLIVPGAKPGIYLPLKLLTSIGSKWLIPIPYWTSYPDMVESVNGKSILLESNVENNWEIDLDIIENNYKSELINGIILCNPNNPTGLLYSETFISKLVELSRRYNKYIIADEVYLPLTSRNTIYKNNYENIIVISSFSKYWAVPGWRVGWILSNKNIINKLVKIQSTIFTCAPTASQEVCIKLLQDKFKPDLSVLEKAKVRLRNIFIEKGWDVPENKELSMYLFPVNNNINMDSYIEKLLDKGLGVISGEAFGYRNAIRITLPNSEKVLIKMENIIRSIID